MPSREADERLLSTLASSMGVALENARLFDETKRLLAETDQRAAELAVINEIGAALAQQLDFQAIVDLVGERVRAIFDAQIDVHRALRPGARTSSRFPYAIDARRSAIELRTPRRARDRASRAAIIQTGRPVRVRLGRRGATASARSRSAARTRESWLGVPILSGDRVTGVIALESLEQGRLHARPTSGC